MLYYLLRHQIIQIIQPDLSPVNDKESWQSRNTSRVATLPFFLLNPCGWVLKEARLSIKRASLYLRASNGSSVLGLFRDPENSFCSNIFKLNLFVQCD
jgi:hypothetical protein